jgi:hypothetical protein
MSVTRPPTFLYELLPIVLRRRDVERGDRALQALTAVAQSAFALLENDIAALYDNWFVETCEPWVLPYLADLVAIPPLLSAQRPAADLRRFVANVTDYRRLKGTVAALEGVVRDVSGWPARVLEGRRDVARTPHAGAFERDATGTLDVGDASALEGLGTPFDTSVRTIDVRGLGSSANTLAARGVRAPGTQREIAVSVWRSQPMSLWFVDAHAVAAHPHAYTFDPLGADRRLVNPPSYSAAPAERAIPAPLRNAVLADELAQRTPPLFFTGDPVALVIEVERGGKREVLDTAELMIADLAAWHGAVKGKALVDVERGRFVLDQRWSRPRCTFTWAVGGDVGGGPYRKDVATSSAQGELLVARDPALARATFATAGAGAAGVPATFTTVEAALDAARALRGFVRITVMDNGTYVAPRGGWTIALTPDVSRVEVRAWPGPRPVLRGALAVAVRTDGARVRVDGIVVDGAVTIDASSASSDVRIDFVDSTLVPHAHPSLAAAAGMLDGTIALERTICGAVVLPELGPRLTADASIIDGAHGTAIGGRDGAPGPDTVLRRCTVLGNVHVLAADVQGSIVDGTLRVAAGDASAARHSAIRRVEGIDVPPSVRLGPVRFASRRYGTEGHARLPLESDPFLLAGAANGEELGAYHAAATGRRLANVRTVLDEYVPYGVAAGVIDEG